MEMSDETSRRGKMNGEDADRIVSEYKAAPTDADADRLLEQKATELFVTREELGWLIQALGRCLSRQTDKERLNPGYIDPRRMGISPRTMAFAEYLLCHPDASVDEARAIIKATFAAQAKERRKARVKERRQLSASASRSRN